MILLIAIIINKNYQILKNIQNLKEYNQTVIGDINQIIFEKYIKNKLNYIYDMYKKMFIKPIKSIIFYLWED